MPDINRSLLLTSLHNTLFKSLKVLHIHTQMHCDSSTSVFGFGKSAQALHLWILIDSKLTHLFAYLCSDAYLFCAMHGWRASFRICLLWMVVFLRKNTYYLAIPWHLLSFFTFLPCENCWTLCNYSYINLTLQSSKTHLLAGQMCTTARNTQNKHRRIMIALV